MVATTREAWDALVSNPTGLFRAVVLPAVFIIALDFVPESIPTLHALAGLAGWMLYSALAVQVHRHILQNEGDPVLPRRPADIGLYILWSLLIGMLVIVPYGLLLWAYRGSSIIWFLWVIPVLYVTARASLLLPNRALGERASIKEVWGWSRNEGWRLAGSLFIPPVLVSIAVALMISGFEKQIHDVVETVISVPVQMFTIAVLSVAYRNFRPVLVEEYEPE